MNKKKVLFFANPFYLDLTKDFCSEFVDAIYVTLSIKEKNKLLERGSQVVGCFEEEYNNLLLNVELDGNYLRTSFSSDRFLGRFTLDKRYEILKKEIIFWRNIFDFHKPNFIVHETVTLEITEVMAIEAEKRGIKYYSFLSGFRPYTFYWKDNPFNSQFTDISTEISDEDIENAKMYIDGIRSEKLKPFYVHNLKKFSKFSRLYELIKIDIPHYLFYKVQEIFHKGFKYEINSKGVLLNIYRSIHLLIHRYDTLDFNSNKEYVFYPLHFEPEATLSYFVNPYVDQSTVIETIARALKTNQILIVKEHPQQLGSLFEDKFQVVRKRNPNIIYVRGDVSSEEIIQKVNIIVTLTSTAAWEAYIRCKRIIVIGDVFYDKFKGINKCTLSQLNDIIRNDKFEEFNDDDILNACSFVMSKLRIGAPFPYKNCSKEQQRLDYIRNIEEISKNII